MVWDRREKKRCSIDILISCWVYRINANNFYLFICCLIESEREISSWTVYLFERKIVMVILYGPSRKYVLRKHTLDLRSIVRSIFFYARKYNLPVQKENIFI